MLLISCTGVYFNITKLQFDSFLQHIYKMYTGCGLPSLACFVEGAEPGFMNQFVCLVRLV